MLVVEGAAPVGRMRKEGMHYVGGGGGGACRQDEGMHYVGGGGGGVCRQDEEGRHALCWWWRGRRLSSG